MDDVISVGTSRGGGDIPEGGADAMRILLRFDTSGLTLPAQRATLELTVHTYISQMPGPEFTVDVHRVVPSAPLTPWVEGNGDETGDEPPFIPGAVNVDAAFGVAWAGAGDNESPDAANNTTQPPFDPDRAGRASVSAGSQPRGTTIRWDVTDLVNDWIAGTPNEGLLLRDPTSDGTFRQVFFATRELEALGDDAPPELRGLSGPRLVVNPIPLPPALAPAAGLLGALAVQQFARRRAARSSGTA
jgi:hypothetical protein